MLRARTQQLAIPIVLGASLVLIAAQANARPAPKVASRTYALHATDADPDGIQPDGARCRVSTQSCEAIVRGQGTTGGDLRGAASYVIYISRPTDATGEPHWEGTLDWQGSVARCGTGTVTFRVTDGAYETMSFDPVTRHSRARETWTIVRGSGTGALTGASGSASNAVDDHNDGSTNGTLTGTFTCGHALTR